MKHSFLLVILRLIFQVYSSHTYEIDYINQYQFYLAANAGGYCLWSQIPLELLYISWENSPNFVLGQRAEMISTIDMHSCFLKVWRHQMTLE